MQTFALLAVLAALAAPLEDHTVAPLKQEYVPPLQKKLLEQPADPLANDARLNDIAFVDPQNGWAVGDRGVIWHTGDGGKTWQQQNSGVKCTLSSVCFLDEKTGFAAGGRAVPYSHRSVGVLLATRDGGQTWSYNARLVLPALKRMGFFDAAHGWAIATPSAMYPSGAFVTDDSGKTWKPLPGAGSSGWLTGDFLDSRTAVLAGRNGTLGQVASGSIDSPQEAVYGLRNLRQLRLSLRDPGWMAGDGGIVAATGDLGMHWQPPLGALPEGTVENFDFAALALRGPKIWIAGTPGSLVFHSPDSGRTWSEFPTGSPLPLQTMAFVDDLHGWAAGALGTILTTADGGRTWQLQRGGGGRAAVLGLFAESEDIPFEFFAKISAQDGYLSVAEAIARRDIEVPPDGEVPLADRVHQAAVEVGACEGILAWNFPLRQKGIQISAPQFVEGWDRANDGRGMAEFRAHLVRQIRIWRPELIVTQEVGPRTNDPLSQLIGGSVIQAVEDAGNPAMFSSQITLAGLLPWKVKKVYAATTAGTHGAADLTTSQLASRLGASLADAAADSRGSIAERFAPPPATIGFRSLFARAAGEDSGRDSSGIVIQTGKDARREMLAAPAENLEMLHQAAMKRRNAQAIIEISARNALSASQLLAQADMLISGLDDASSGRILYQIGDTYARAGRWSMAAETYRAFLARYPNHPLSSSAILWLMRYYTSGETVWRERREREIGSRPPALPNTVKQMASNSTGGSPVEQEEDRLGMAIALGKEVEHTRPELFADPAFRFPLAAVERQKTAPRQIAQFYLAESRSASADAWSQCAQGEIWFVDRKQKSPKPLLPCAQTKEKPKLDGVLDEEIWHKARPVPLVSAQHDDDAWPASASFAYDAEFLYIALTCKKKPAAEERLGTTSPAAKNEEPRPRDADLTAHDRIDILLDIDRDYATYYRFTVDHRGWTAESCFGDRSWNPDWYVAAKETEESWIAEIAIPLSELAGRPPQPHDAWAIGIQRTVPGVGFQSWTTPASTEIMPQGFGYLIFD